MKKNIFYSILNNIINAVFPILIIPIATQKLTPDAFGYAAFLLTIYTTCLATSQIGFDAYGLRELSSNQNERNKCNAIYSELVFTHIALITAIAIILIATKLSNNLSISSIDLILIVLTLYASSLQTDWLFFAYGDFKNIVLRNFIIKALATCAIIGILKENDPGSSYTTIILMSYIASSIWTYLIGKKYISISNVSPSKIAMRFYEIKTFGISKIMSGIIQNADILAVGFLCKPEETGFYFIARKVTQAGIQLFSTISVVFNNELYKSIRRGNVQNNNVLQGLDISIFFSLITSIVISFNGVAIINILSGHGYVINSSILQILSLLIVISAYTNHIGINVLYFFKMENAVAKSMIISAFLMFLTTYPLISKYGIFGGAISIVAANTLIATLQSIYASKMMKNFKAQIIKANLKNIFYATVLFALYKITAVSGISYESINMKMALANMAIVFIFLTIYIWPKFRKTA